MRHARGQAAARHPGAPSPVTPGASEVLAGYVTEFSAEALLDAFPVHGAQALLLVGSRVTGSDQPGSDIDFLAIYDDGREMPARVPLPGAVCMPHSLGENWIGVIGGQEVNVEAVTAGTIRRVASLLSQPLDARRAPILQPLEIRLLDRLRRHVPLRGAAYVHSLGTGAAVARLPMAAVVSRFCGVTSNLPAARARLEEGDVAGLSLVTSAMAGALGLATMNLHGNMDIAWRKVVPALRELEREHGEIPVTADDLAAVLAAGPRAALEGVAAGLDRLRAAVRQRADAGDPLWIEALHGLDAQ